MTVALTLIIELELIQLATAHVALPHLLEIVVPAESVFHEHGLVCAARVIVSLPAFLVRHDAVREVDLLKLLVGINVRGRCSRKNLVGMKAQRKSDQDKRRVSECDSLILPCLAKPALLTFGMPS